MLGTAAGATATTAAAGGARGDRDRDVRGGDRGRDAPRTTRVVRR